MVRGKAHFFPSLYTSPAMLMASCETTRALASILNVTTDRLAILCTSPINDHRTLGSDFTRLWPLVGIKDRRLKIVLDAIVNTNERSTTCSWAQTIKTATEILLQSKVTDPDAELLHDSFGHVIILSNSPGGLAADILTHEKLQFHMICPTSVPFKDFDDIECNGWKLRSLGDNEPQFLKLRRDTDSMCLLSMLRRLIRHARSGKSSGKLSDLSLRIKAGPDCTVHGIRGDTEYLTLHPGELRSVLVNLSIHAPGVPPDSTDSPIASPELSPDSIDVLKELDEMLRVVPRPVRILTARLQYQHPLLPTGTTCSISVDCRITKHISRSKTNVNPDMLFANGLIYFSPTIHERLACYLATHGPTKQALTALRQEFGPDGRRSYCPDYTQFVLKEVKYQARIEDRLELALSPRKRRPLTLETIPTPESAESGFRDWTSRDIGPAETSRCESWTIVPKDEDAFRGNSQDATESEPKTLILSPQKRFNALAHGHGFSENRKPIVAVRHKRSESQPVSPLNKESIRTSTIRRIMSAGESLGRGLGAMSREF